MLTPKKTDFRFGGVVFFGRGIAEYKSMFDLDLDSLMGKLVLDCPAGPASFACEAVDLGISVIACDPMFVYAPAELREVVDNDSASVTEKQERNRQLFHDELVPTAQRRNSMEVFLQDYESGPNKQRYVAASLPSLPFADSAFDLVLSGNLLFIYSDPESGGMLENSPFDYQFHKNAIVEMLRVCRGQVRIYPLQGPAVAEHSYLRQIILDCREMGIMAELQPVPQRDIIGAERMLVLTK
jgi:hypothetical protein